MDDVPGLYERALAHFGNLLRSVRPDQWSGATPCAEWDVRALSNHVLSENRWVPPMLAGRTIAEVGDELEGDLLGDDPVASWDEAAADAVAAAREPGALERTVHLSFGDFSGRLYIGQVLSDHVIHAWDLARAIGADEKVDPDLVRFAYDELKPQLDEWRSGGAFGPKVDVPGDADLQTKLLAEAGRKV